MKAKIEFNPKIKFIGDPPNDIDGYLGRLYPLIGDACRAEEMMFSDEIDELERQIARQ